MKTRSAGILFVLFLLVLIISIVKRPEPWLDEAMLMLNTLTIHGRAFLAPLPLFD